MQVMLPNLRPTQNPMNRMEVHLTKKHLPMSCSRLVQLSFPRDLNLKQMIATLGFRDAVEIAGPEVWSVLSCYAKHLLLEALDVGVGMEPAGGLGLLQVPRTTPHLLVARIQWALVVGFPNCFALLHVPEQLRN